MSSLVHKMKAEPADLSDSDSDKLLIEESTCDTVDEERWIRRSSRARRSSTRFSDFFTGEEESTAPRAAPKTSKNRADGAKKSTWRSSTKVEPEPTKEVKGTFEPLEVVPNGPVDPEFLVSYVEKTKKTILPGQVAVKMPAGPNGEFVNLDGVEYLQSLGYYEYDSLIEEEDVVEEIAEIESEPTLHVPDCPRNTGTTEKELLRRRIEFEAQRAMMTKNASNFTHHEFEAQAVTTISPVNSDHLEPTPASPVYRIKEVDEPDQFSSASAYSSDEEQDGSIGTVDEIDVTGGSPPRPLPVALAVEHPYTKAPVIEILSDSSSQEASSSSKSKRKRKRKITEEEKGRRSVHNVMEKARRQELADLFSYLKESIEQIEIERFDGARPSKVAILGESQRIIAELKRTSEWSAKFKIQLDAENKRLRARYGELEAALKGLKSRRYMKRLLSKHNAISGALDQLDNKRPRLMLNSNEF